MTLVLRNGLLSIHVPKTGGKTWERWLDNIAHATTKKIHSQHFSFKDIITFSPMYNEWDYIMIVRNPYSRLVSWYWHGRDTYINNINKPVNISKKLPKISPRWGDSFDEWVKKQHVADFPSCTKNRTNIFMGTCKSYMHPSGRMPKYLLRTETLDKDIKPLQDLFNCYKPLPRINVSTASKLNWKKEYKSEYTKDLVYEYYKEDFETFDYPKEFPSD